MKVTVTKNLNVRVGEPKLDAPCYQYLAPGSELEIDGKTYKGDKYRGNDNWYRDEANNYYWSGGVESALQSNYGKISDFWWLESFDVNIFWNNGFRGSGVKVAVLDTGLSLPHHDLTIPLEDIADLTRSSSSIADLTGHGTHVTGIIKASHNKTGVFGVAPEVELLFGKVTGDLGDDPDLLAKGISWATSREVDIISISKGFQESSEALKKAVSQATKNGILLICAAGNKIDENHTKLDFPARYSSEFDLLTVGGIDENRSPLTDTIDESTTDIFAPGESIKSTFLDEKYRELSGSSQATAYVAGVAALALQKSRQRPAILLKKSIKAHSKNKIINPEEIYKHV